MKSPATTGFPDGTHNPSRTAFIFPGQGSHAVGMGLQLYEKSHAAREVFEAVDAALDTPISSTLFRGPAEELTRTDNSQPAIFSMSLACLMAMQEVLGENHPRPSVVAGHSLGEYTALVAAGVIDVEDGVRLVRERGRLMQKAAEIVPSGMAAVIGLDEWTVREVCQESGVQVANINSQNQVVISGERIALAWASDLASKRGARKVIQLRVSGAFHSELMRPAMEGMTRALEDVHLKHPAVPVVANCTGEILTTSDQVRNELLQQLCNCVQWQRTMECMIGSGISTFLEIGPGQVLSGLARRMNSNIMVKSIGDMDAIQSLKDSLDLR